MVVSSLFMYFQEPTKIKDSTTRTCTNITTIRNQQTHLPTDRECCMSTIEQRLWTTVSRVRVENVKGRGHMTVQAAPERQLIFSVSVSKLLFCKRSQKFGCLLKFFQWLSISNSFFLNVNTTCGPHSAHVLNRQVIC